MTVRVRSVRYRRAASWRFGAVFLVAAPRADEFPCAFDLRRCRRLLVEPFNDCVHLLLDFSVIDTGRQRGGDGEEGWIPPHLEPGLDHGRELRFDESPV